PAALPTLAPRGEPVRPLLEAKVGGAGCLQPVPPGGVPDMDRLARPAAGREQGAIPKTGCRARNGSSTSAALGRRGRAPVYRAWVTPLRVTQAPAGEACAGMAATLLLPRLAASRTAAGSS